MPARHAALVAIAVLVAALPAVADELPPLIDRDVFFGDPKVAGAQISPDGRWISFRAPHHDVMNIWVKRTNEPFEAARPLTADRDRPIRGYFWTEDSRFILYVQDKAGNEDFHVYAVDPAAPAGEADVPESRDLTPIDGVRAYIYAVPENTPGQIIVGLNDRDPAMHDVYRLSIDTGERELLITNEANVGQWVTDLQGNVRLAWRQTPDGGSEILRVEDGRLGEVIYTCNFEESCFPVRFHKDGRQAYLMSNKGEDVDLIRLILIDADDGSTQLVEVDPEGEVDFGSPIFSDETEELVGTTYVGDRQRIYPRTPRLEKDLSFLKRTLPDGELSISAQTEDERLWIVSVSRDVNPGQVFVYDRNRATVEKLYDARPELPTEHLAPMRPLRYPARDGTEIPAYLVTPKGADPSNLPTVILPHGGPWARDTWGYDSFAQFLANRGYAVLMPNFRGSTGYGKAFLNAGNEEWGTGVMQHDLTDAVGYLVEKGIADPQRVAIMGGSYGGYATLAGVTYTPELYAAGVSIVGPSNIITLLDSIPAYWGPIRKIFHIRVGDPADPADRTRLEEQSPFYHADRIKTPLLVIQGANDPRVKKAESDQIVVALRDLQRDIEYLVAPDEGHGFAGEENRLAMFAVIEEFLAKHLGGRYQPGAPTEVAERIEALRVNVATVEMPTVPEAGEWAKTAPLPEPDAGLLAPETLRYQATLSLPGGQQMELDGTRRLTRDEHEGRPVWRIETSTTMPMGEATDVVVLDAATLRPLHRSVTQGPVTVELAYSDAVITGLMKLPGQEIPIDVALEAPVLASDAALEVVLGALPLDPVYQTMYRTFDVQTQKVRTWSFEVTGRETIETEAGSFDCFKTLITSLDGEGGDGTLWIAAEAPRATVRSESRLPPAMGGGQIVRELVLPRGQ